MAKVSLKYPVYTQLTETDDSVSYGTGKVLARAIEANITVENNDAKLWADDTLDDSDSGFKSGKISLNTNDIPDYAKIDLLGHTEGDIVDADIGTKEIISRDTDEAPFVGFGFYGMIKKKIDNAKVTRWRAIFLRKVQFAEPNDQNKTRSEALEYQTPTIEGNVMRDVTRQWKNEGTFSTEAKAKTWLNGKANIIAKASGVASSVTSGVYTAAQSVVLSTAETGGTIYYTTNGTIPDAETGTEYTAPITLDKPSNTCIKAICTETDKATSDILELYIKVTE